MSYDDWLNGLALIYSNRLVDVVVVVTQYCVYVFHCDVEEQVCTSIL